MKDNEQLYKEALLKIINYKPKFDTDKMREKLSKECEECPECQYARQRNWPPSGLCNKHYTEWSEVWDREELIRNTQSLDMRNIARDALKEAEKTENKQAYAVIVIEDGDISELKICKTKERAKEILCELQEGLTEYDVDINTYSAGIYIADLVE